MKILTISFSFLFLVAIYILYIFLKPSEPPPSKTYANPYKEATPVIPSITPTSASNCDPNYSGCVPISSDVDCAGGNGNGPAYVRGPIKVLKNDIYDLDGDRDGIACEK